MLPSVVLCFFSLLTSCVKGLRDHTGPPEHEDPIGRTCELIKHYHCGFFRDDPHCGTDHRTYTNMCEFSKAHCELRDLHIAHKGVCINITTTTTTTTSNSNTNSSSSSNSNSGSARPTAAVPGEDTVYQFFCRNLGHQQCGSDQQILCGSDGLTYTNLSVEYRN